MTLNEKEIAIEIKSKCENEEQLAEYPISHLVIFYNRYAKLYDGKDQIKKFRDKETAVKRCVPYLKKPEQSCKTMGVCKFIDQLILQGAKPDTILEFVKKSYPESKSTKRDIYWRRFRLKKLGNEIPASHYTRKAK